MLADDGGDLGGWAKFKTMAANRRAHVSSSHTKYEQSRRGLGRKLTLGSSDGIRELSSPRMAAQRARGALVAVGAAVTISAS